LEGAAFLTEIFQAKFWKEEPLRLRKNFSQRFERRSLSDLEKISANRLEGGAFFT